MGLAIQAADVIRKASSVSAADVTLVPRGIECQQGRC